MNNFLFVKYQGLSSGEKSVLATISVLPSSWYSVKELFFYLDIHNGSEEGVKFFDTLHTLARKGWLYVTKGCYKVSDTAVGFLKSHKISEQRYLKVLIDKVSGYFAKPDITKRRKEYEHIAANILEKIKSPSKKLALLAKNFSKYCLNLKQKCLALKYSDMAVDIQEQVDVHDEDLCSIFAEKAAVLNSAGKYGEAIETGLKCLDFCVMHKRTNKTKTYALELCYGVMSSAFERLNDYKKSLLYALKAIETGRRNRNFGVYEQAVSYYNAAVSYFKDNEYARARFYIIKAYAEYCNENGGHRPGWFSKWNVRRIVICVRYRISYLFSKVFRNN